MSIYDIFIFTHFIISAVTSKARQLVWTLFHNKIGIALGLAYSSFSFLVFFVGLSYGASCPEAGPNVCDNPPFYVAITGSIATFIFMLPHIISWSSLAYREHKLWTIPKLEYHIQPFQRLHPILLQLDQGTKNHLLCN